MSAAKESLNALPQRLGIIAGGGSLPAQLAQSCRSQGVDVFIVGLEGQADASALQGEDVFWSKLGRAGRIIEELHKKSIYDLVLIGSIHRPSIKEILPDFRTAEFLVQIGLKSLGDNDFLSEIRHALEEDGFRIHGAHKFAPEFLAPKGVIGRHAPQEGDWADIERGIEVVQAIGALDVGQATIVQEGLVLGMEAAEGTDGLIHRCAGLKRKGRGGVLVKLCKPQQDKDLDMPTIGPRTIENAAKAKLAGIVVHAGETLIVDTPQVAKLADKHKMFVMAVDPNDPKNL